MISFFDKQTDRQFYNYSDPAPFFLLISEQNLEAASFKSSSRMLEGNSLESDWMSIFIDRWLLVDIRVLRSVIRQFWEENALSALTTWSLLSSSMKCDTTLARLTAPPFVNTLTILASMHTVHINFPWELTSRPGNSFFHLFMQSSVSTF